MVAVLIFMELGRKEPSELPEVLTFWHEIGLSEFGVDTFVREYDAWIG